MTKDEALQMCLEYIETAAHERKYVRHAIKEALAQPEQQPCNDYCLGWNAAKASMRQMIAEKQDWEAKLKEKNG
jgi:hypothetical protein